jgi:hypothetical protein
MLMAIQTSIGEECDQPLEQNIFVGEGKIVFKRFMYCL